MASVKAVYMTFAALVFNETVYAVVSVKKAQTFTLERNHKEPELPLKCIRDKHDFMVIN